MRLGLAVCDLMAKLLKSSSLSKLGSACRMLDLVLVHVIFGRLEVHGEFGVVRQRLVLWIILVQIEVVVVRYVGVWLDRGYVSGRSALSTSVEVQFRVRESSCRVRAIPRA